MNKNYMSHPVSSCRINRFQHCKAPNCNTSKEKYTMSTDIRNISFSNVQKFCNAPLIASKEGF